MQNLFQKLLISNFLILCTTPAYAQIVPDQTLSSEASRLTPNVLIKNTLGDRIDGGATRGSNLFHSFSQFNIGDGQRVYFSNPSGVQNIFTRVTGGNASNILGTLGVDGSANLFLINPNGILFGRNASLDVGGSFVGTTAYSLKFADGTFSAIAPQTTLLTINVPIGLQFGETGGNITVTGSTLAVPPGKTLGLVGGDVNLNGGFLEAPNGRIELGAIAAPGKVGLNFTGDNLSLSFPDNLLRADVSLTDRASVDVSDRGQGSVGVTARNLNILEGSSITSGIKQEAQADSSLPGNIILNTTGLLTINNLSRVTNVVPEGVTGNAGDINITAGDIYIDNRASTPTDSYVRAALEAGSGGNGRAGNISLSATGSITLIGQDVGYGDFAISTFFLDSKISGGGDITLTANGSISLEAAYLTGAQGNGKGNISILGKKSVSITKQSLLDAGTDRGNSANITITSDGPISIDRSFLGNNVGINTFQTIPGNAGDIKISGGSVFVTGGSLIESSSEKKGGNSGNINLTATDTVEISGYNQQFPGTRTFKSPYTTLRTTSLAGSLGQGGKITVLAPTFRVSDKAIVRTDSQSDFRGGDINVNANIVELMGGGQLFTTARSSGNAGNIALKVGDRIVLSGSNLNYADEQIRFSETLEESQKSGQLEPLVAMGALEALKAVNPNSGLFANTQAGTGNGGSIEINTSSLSLSDGAQVLASTFGQGDAGRINAQVKELVLLTDNSQIRSAVESPSATGNGTQISISARSLLVNNGSQITTQTQGEGNAGNINIDANTIEAASGGKVLTSTSGSGRAGNITVNLSDRFFLSGADTGLFANTEPGSSGKSGDIQIRARSLSISDGAELSASTQGNGKAGNIQVDAVDSVTLTGVSVSGLLTNTDPAVSTGFTDLDSISDPLSKVGFSSGLFTNTDKGANGQGGNITVRTGVLRILDGAVLSARTISEFDGGDITVNANNLEIRGGGQMLTTAFSNGNAGSITVNASDSINISGNDPTYSRRVAEIGRPTVDPVSDASGLFSSTNLDSTGNGGNINIRAGELLVQDGAQVNMSSQGTGNAGSLKVEANSIELDNQGKLLASTASGEGGNIDLQVRDLILMRHQSLISAQADKNGNGGNTTINSPFIVAVKSENSDIAANAFRGRGGNINITTSGIYGLEYRPQLTQFSDINASSQFGVNGTVQINTLGIDPSRGLINLPTEPVEPKVASGCTTGTSKNQSRFVVTGRGGLPPNPREAFNSDAVRVDWVTLNRGSDNRTRQTTTTIPTPAPIVEATGLAINAKGEVLLTAEPSTATVHSSWQTPTTCSALKSKE